jgi:hypothetical protein
VLLTTTALLACAGIATPNPHEITFLCATGRHHSGLPMRVDRLALRRQRIVTCLTDGHRRLVKSSLRRK